MRIKWNNVCTTFSTSPGTQQVINREITTSVIGQGLDPGGGRVTTLFSEMAGPDDSL